MAPLPVLMADFRCYVATYWRVKAAVYCDLPKGRGLGWVWLHEWEQKYLVLRAAGTQNPKCTAVSLPLGCGPGLYYLRGVHLGTIPSLQKSCMQKRMATTAPGCPGCGFQQCWGGGKQKHSSCNATGPWPRGSIGRLVLTSTIPNGQKQHTIEWCSYCLSLSTLFLLKVSLHIRTDHKGE